MQRTVVLNVVGLSPSLIGDDTPRLRAWAGRAATATIEPAFPALTCPAQATYLTGETPGRHGVVGNGWYDRAYAETRFWKQSNHLIERPKIWQTAKERDPSFTCANLFWWFNMHCGTEWAATVRPMYPADGRKVPDVYTNPPDLRHRLQRELGRFPLFNFWGPTANLESSRWIADAAGFVEREGDPTLTLVYLPHLDYSLQRMSSSDPLLATNLREIDDVVGDLIEAYESRGCDVVVLSEYGIERVDTPVHINRVLREEGLLRVREELGLELLDAGGSRAFAVADHQIAHVYVNDPEAAAEVRSLLEGVEGIERVLDAEGKREMGVDHERSGDLVAVAAPGAWFTYYYWLSDDRAPDFARTVDIHRKPGYDPVELFFDPSLEAPRLKVALKIFFRMLGFRALLDVIPLDASLVRGSHGRPATAPEAGPLLITKREDTLPGERIDATDVRDVLLRHIFDEPRPAGAEARAGATQAAT